MPKNSILSPDWKKRDNRNEQIHVTVSGWAVIQRSTDIYVIPVSYSEVPGLDSQLEIEQFRSSKTQRNKLTWRDLVYKKTRDNVYKNIRMHNLYWYLNIGRREEEKWYQRCRCQRKRQPEVDTRVEIWMSVNRYTRTYKCTFIRRYMWIYMHKDIHKCL